MEGSSTDVTQVTQQTPYYWTSDGANDALDHYLIIRQLLTLWIRALGVTIHRGGTIIVTFRACGPIDHVI